MFAATKRFGHSEHSYRFVNAGLAKQPFAVPIDLLEGFCKWHEPLSVTRLGARTNPATRLYPGEEKLIAEKLVHYPVKTICEFTPPSNLDIRPRRDRYSWFRKASFLTEMLFLDCYRSLRRKASMRRSKMEEIK